MPKPDREKLTLLSAALLLTLAATVVLRGGGYGIAGLTWNTELEVGRSTLRIGPYTVLPGDRIRSVNSRSVHRDADLRGVLRALEADEIWLEVERADYRVAVPLTPEAIERNELPAILRGPYQVVRIDNREIEGDMNLAVMASWMEMNGGRPAVFTLSVPDYTFEGPARRVRRPGPIAPVVILVITAGMVLLAWIRGRAEVMTRPRESWHLLGVSLAAGGVLLAFLSWHDGVMADPVLLPFALASLCLWRPSSLFLHQAQRGRLHGPAAIYFRLGAGVPAMILLLASLYGWARSLSDLSGTPLDGFVYDQLRLIVLVGAGATALYHLADLGLQASELRGRRRPDQARPSPAWLGGILASLFIVSALVGLAADPAGFFTRGYVFHLAGLVTVQWLGDMALLPRRSRMLDLDRREEDAPELASYLVGAAEALDLQNPQYACRLARTSVVLALSKPATEQSAEEPADQPETESDAAVPSLRAQPLDEPLAGLLELLEAEGGMFPRYKTIRGTDESDDDPFDGLDRTVGVELVLPLSPPNRQEGETMQAFLVSRPAAEVEVPAALPSDEALQTWRRLFASRPETWSRLRSAAAEGALELLMSDQAAPPDDFEPTDEMEEVEVDQTRILSAALHYAQQAIDQAYPIHETSLVPPDELVDLDTFAGSKGPMAIVGGLGVGRELTARLIHLRSGLPGGFVVLDCSTLPESLVMAELVGEGDVPGRLAAAEDGTICIRDLATLGEATQSEALSAIKSASARPILVEREDTRGEPHLSDPIRRAVDEAVLRIPPLAQRPDAIERAAKYYLHQFAMRLGRVVTGFTPEAITWLRKQPWPANFHSLIPCIRDAVVRSSTQQVGLEELKPAPAETASVGDLATTVEQVEREAVIQALERSGGNKSKAARLLGMKRTTFIRKLAKYSADP